MRAYEFTNKNITNEQQLNEFAPLLILAGEAALEFIEIAGPFLLRLIAGSATTAAEIGVQRAIPLTIAGVIYDVYQHLEPFIPDGRKVVKASDEITDYIKNNFPELAQKAGTYLIQFADLTVKFGLPLALIIGLIGLAYYGKKAFDYFTSKRQDKTNASARVYNRNT
jgi:hypothetical protein